MWDAFLAAKVEMRGNSISAGQIAVNFDRLTLKADTLFRSIPEAKRLVLATITSKAVLNALFNEAEFVDLMTFSRVTKLPPTQWEK